MKRLATTIAVLGLLTAACAGAGSGSLGPAPTGGTATPAPSPTEDARPSPSPGETEEPDATGPPPSPGRSKPFTYEVWFASDFQKLFLSKRTEEFGPAVARMAMNALLAGPNESERAAGISTAIPGGTRLLGLDLDGGVVTVDLSSEFEQGSGTAGEETRLAQVVYTLTQFDTVRAVSFRIDGKPVKVFGGHGIVLEKPQGREDFESFLPLIVVETPVAGTRVDNPVTISGFANVFEATVSIRILDGGGREVARTFTTATCGTGCWGDFSVAVPYSVSREQSGVVEVFESSPEDGSALNVVTIPVTLTP